jgi:hypothetical protein
MTTEALKTRRNALAEKANMRGGHDHKGHEIALADDMDAIREISRINAILARRRRESHESNAIRNT